ncbi:MAG: bifunctional diaminohydroxyphosphoribosylaminopyrimidine deaminase/5-amino-6-(5-phosphoribosylamino)uracil reductase RibD [Brevinema sp.]
MDHVFFMNRALEIARQGFVSPNPQVGAVIVENNHIIAEGFHAQFGGAHAEVNAINALPQGYDCSKATLYVTLEPCSHTGKTPPCVDLVLSKGFRRVVVACRDSNPLVAGKGIEKLLNAGVDVIEGICQQEALVLNESFFYAITHKKPYIVFKAAISLDGKIATKTGESQWISNVLSRGIAHEMRSRYSAIMAGVGTVLADDPLLTSRIENGRNPTRIIVDTNLRTPLSSKIVATAKEVPTYIATCCLDETKKQRYESEGVHFISVGAKNGQADLSELIDILGTMGIDSILLEGGAKIAGSMIEERLIQKIVLFVAPKIIGGSAYNFIDHLGVEKIDDVFTLERSSIQLLGDDLMYVAYMKEN